MYHAVFFSFVGMICGLIANKIERGKRPNQVQIPYFRFIHYGATFYHGDDCQGEMDSAGPYVEFGCTDTCFSGDGSRSVFIEARWYYVLWRADLQYKHVATEGPVVDAYGYGCEQANLVTRAHVPKGQESACVNFNETIFNFELRFLLECRNRERPPLHAAPAGGVPGGYIDWYAETTKGYPDWAVEEGGVPTIVEEGTQDYAPPDSVPDALREAIEHGTLPEDDGSWDWDEDEDDGDVDGEGEDGEVEKVSAKDKAAMTNDELRRHRERKCKANCFKKARKEFKETGEQAALKKEEKCKRKCHRKAQKPPKENLIFPETGP